MSTSSVRVCLVFWWAICGFAGTGCTSCDSLLGKELNPLYCGSATCRPDGGGCGSNADCMSPEVCDTMANHCVQCTATDHAACTGNTPTCGTDGTCRACAAHSECVSGACSFADGSGSCAPESDVAYVDSVNGNNNPTCGKSTPCATVTAALKAGQQRYIKISGTIDDAVVVNNLRRVTFLADPGAMLTRRGGGNVLAIEDAGTSLTIYDLTISGAKDPAAGISVDMGATLSLMRAIVSNNEGGGVSSAGTLVIAHSKITNNGSSKPGVVVNGGSFSLAQSLVSGNRSGGVQVTTVTAKFAIVSNTFVSNGSGGDMGSMTGAVNIGVNFNSANLLEFNTFYENLSINGSGSAIRCDPATFTARANIMFNNGTMGPNQTSGTCMHIYSITRPGSVPSGTGNQASDPLFVDKAGGNFHLQVGSPAIGAANALVPLNGLSARDFDDHPRLPPVNLGAYQ